MSPFLFSLSSRYGDAGDVGGFDMFLRNPAHSALSTTLNNNSFGLGTGGSLEHSPTPADPKDGRKVCIESFIHSFINPSYIQYSTV